MKAVVIHEPGKISLEQVSIPEPQPGFVRIKVMAAAICATDLEVLDGNIPANYPLTPGHEWSGIVDAVGSEEDSVQHGVRDEEVCILRICAPGSGNHEAGCQAHCTVMLSEVDQKIFKKLGVGLTCDPVKKIE